MKRNRRNYWYTVSGQSLALYARDAGFDLAVYREYPPSARAMLRRRAVLTALKAIRLACEEQGLDLAHVHRGVYVISLSHPLSIRYLRGRSAVIYIGIGNILTRLKTHFSRKLFDFMLGLSGAEFDFHVARPARPGAYYYYKHVEHLMLKQFNEQYGGLDDKSRRFPILNTNAAGSRKYSEGSDWWKEPLLAKGRRPLWELRPTDWSDFAPLQ